MELTPALIKAISGLELARSEEINVDDEYINLDDYGVN